MYCQVGQKPTVRYKFGNGAERVYKSNYAPIDVVTKSKPPTASDNYNREGYQLIFRPLNSGLGIFSTVVVDYQLFYAPALASEGLQNLLAYIPCGQLNYTYNPNCDSYSRYSGCINSSPIDINSLIIDPTKKCPNPNQERCSIQIIERGVIVFQDQGECPINFSVQCDDCADDEIKCQKSAYPGYCCIKCSEVSFGLQLIEGSLRSKI